MRTGAPNGKPGAGANVRGEVSSRGMLDFDAFAARAQELAAAFPPEFLEGIDTVDVHEDAQGHPHVPGVYTLGACETSHLSDPTGETPNRSVVHLYHGSFAALAAEDPDFDVEAELEATLEHEIRHHLEDRAGEQALADEDGLFEAHARFRAGLEVPAGWYRRGDELEPGLFAVDLDLFLELPLRRVEWDRLPGTRLALRLLGGELGIDVPDDASPDEIWTFEGEGLVDDEDDDDEDDEEGDEGDVAEGSDEERGADGPRAADPDEEEPSGPVGDLHVVPLVR